MHAVALRKESVDRNIKLKSGTFRDNVALRKESVDRMQDKGVDMADKGRSPQGERG